MNTECNAEHERDADFHDNRDQMLQDAGLEPATSPYFYPSDEVLSESLGPDAWYANIDGPKKGKNDNYRLVLGKMREYMAERDYAAIGELIFEYSQEYLRSCADDHDLEFDVNYLGDE